MAVLFRVMGCAGDQPDEAAPAPVGLRVKGQRGVEVELQESHQPGAALRLPDQRAELLIGGTRRQHGEQRLDVRLADAAEDAVQDVRERPFAGEHVAAYHHVAHLFGCHLFLLSPDLSLRHAGPGRHRIRLDPSAEIVRAAQHHGIARTSHSLPTQERQPSPSWWARDLDARAGRTYTPDVRTR
jgi:hypothetical protein